MEGPPRGSSGSGPENNGYFQTACEFWGSSEWHNKHRTKVLVIFLCVSALGLEFKLGAGGGWRLKVVSAFLNLLPHKNNNTGPFAQARTRYVLQQRLLQLLSTAPFHIASVTRLETWLLRSTMLKSYHASKAPPPRDGGPSSQSPARACYSANRHWGFLTEQPCYRASLEAGVGCFRSCLLSCDKD